MQLAENINKTVNAIMEGESPSVAELEELAPLLKQVEEAFKKCRAHIAERIVAGDEIASCKMVKGRASYKIDTMGAYTRLKEHMGESFDPSGWKSILTVSKTGLEKFAKEHGDLKKDEVEALLGPAMAKSEGKPSLRIG